MDTVRPHRMHQPIALLGNPGSDLLVRGCEQPASQIQ